MYKKFVIKDNLLMLVVYSMNTINQCVSVIYNSKSIALHRGITYTQYK